MSDDGTPSIVQVARSIEVERIRRARLRTPEQKLAAGGDLFDAVRERMTCGIRAQFPDFTPEQVQAEFLRRLRVARRLESTS